MTSPLQPAPSYPLRGSARAVQALIAAHAQLGASYGVEDEQIIAEDSLLGHRLLVSMRRELTGWSLIVRGDPPLEAIISLQAEGYSWHQGFDATGEARFDAIPESSLRTMVDLVVTLGALLP